MAVIARPGGRSAQTRKLVFEAASELIVERGHDAIAMTDIAERAGVAATSLYRRWGNVRVLLTEVAVAQLVRERPMPDSGSLRGDLVAWAQGIAVSLKSRNGSSFFKALMVTALPGEAAGSARAAAFAPRVQQIADMLDRARQRREAAPTVDEVLDYVLAPMYMRTLFGAPLNRAMAERLVDRLLGSS